MPKLRLVRRSLWSPLPVGRQLCGQEELPVLLPVHHVPLPAHHLHLHLQHRSRGHAWVSCQSRVSSGRTVPLTPIFKARFKGIVHPKSIFSTISYSPLCWLTLWWHFSYPSNRSGSWQREGIPSGAKTMATYGRHVIKHQTKHMTCS